MNKLKWKVNSIKYKKKLTGMMIFICPPDSMVICEEGEGCIKKIQREALIFIPKNMTVLLETSSEHIKKITIPEHIICDFALNNMHKLKSTRDLSIMDIDSGDFLFLFQDNIKKSVYIIHYMLSLFSDGFFYSIENIKIAAKVSYIIKQNISRKLSVDEISKMLYVSPSTLKRRLRLEKTSYSKLDLDIRMNNAKNLLLLSDDNISTIASKCGYECPSYFSKVFFKYYGKLPSDYK